MVDLVKVKKNRTLDFGGNLSPLVDLIHQNVFCLFFKLPLFYFYGKLGYIVKSVLWEATF